LAALLASTALGASDTYGVVEYGVARYGAAAGAFSLTAGAAVFPSGRALLATVKVYDVGGSGDPLQLSLDLLLMPVRPGAVTYKRSAINTVQVTGLVDNYGVAQSNANTTVYVTIVNADTGASVLAQTQAVYLSANNWSLDVAAANFGQDGNAHYPRLTWTVQAYDQTGSGGVLRRTWTRLAYDGG